MKEADRQVLGAARDNMKKPYNNFDKGRMACSTKGLRRHVIMPVQ